MPTLDPVFSDKPELADLYMVLIEQYGGIGATPRTALESIADDLKHGRLTSDEALGTLGVDRDEMLVAIAYLIEHFAQWSPDRPMFGAI
ncbi:MAG: hypothetical protein EBX09_06300 [Actinobacteria bacterium]|nr:hypothetical protein [Actinomycetota bacterium]